MSKLLLKRDDTSPNPPAPEQLEIGELVMNSVTGKLYTKINNGDIIEYIGHKVCFNPIPEVLFAYENLAPNDLVANFCCAGGIVVVTINKLRLEPADYSFTFVELTNNTAPNNIVLNNPEYSKYTLNNIEYRKAIIPIGISVNSSAYKNISLFKLNIFLDNIKVSEHLLTLQCLEANQ